MTSQTVSLEIAKQLKEAGWSKRCLYAYETSPLMRGSTFIQDEDYESTSYKPSHVQAPMLHEILEELPYVVWVRKTKFKYSLKVLKLKTEYRIEYSRLDEKGNPHWIACEFDTNIHDCLARMWTWAVQEGYITLNQ